MPYKIHFVSGFKFKLDLRIRFIILIECQGKMPFMFISYKSWFSNTFKNRKKTVIWKRRQISILCMIKFTLFHMRILWLLFVKLRLNGLPLKVRFRLTLVIFTDGLFVVVVFTTHFAREALLSNLLSSTTVYLLSRYSYMDPIIIFYFKTIIKWQFQMSLFFTNVTENGSFILYAFYCSGLWMILSQGILGIILSLRFPSLNDLEIFLSDSDPGPERSGGLVCKNLLAKKVCMLKK